jgi:glycosyltransferase involved in cell wall biosynthesis
MVLTKTNTMTRMRVLWFTGVQLPALTGQGLTRAGWQEGLRKALEAYQPEVELGIATFGPEPRPPLIQGNAIYFTLPRPAPRGRLGRIQAAWRHASYTAAEYDACLDLAQGFAPDLVHFHGSENFFGLLAGKLAVPSVLSLQALVNGYRPFLFSDLGWQDLLKRAASREFLRGDGVLHKALGWDKYVLVEQEILKTCQNYMGRTAWDRAVLLAFNPQAHYFPCDEVLADVYYDLEWRPQSGEAPVIYSTTSNAYFKGGLALVKAFVLLDRRGLKDVRLHLGGLDAGSDLGRMIANIAAQDHLMGRLSFLGRLSPDQITQQMLAASAYVLPSHIDNSPNSLCEAMLIGMPCVAAAVGGVPSLVRDGLDGLLYPDRDAYLLADRLALLLADRKQAASLGAQARRTALERHDRRRIAARTVEIYQQVISAANA